MKKILINLVSIIITVIISFSGYGDIETAIDTAELYLDTAMATYDQACGAVNQAQEAVRQIQYEKTPKKQKTMRNELIIAALLLIFMINCFPVGYGDKKATKKTTKTAEQKTINQIKNI